MERPGPPRRGSPPLSARTRFPGRARAGAAALLLAVAAAGGCRAPHPGPPTPEPPPADSVAARGAEGTRGDGTARALPDPATAVRFEIVAVGDTTFQLLLSNGAWVRPGMVGIVVDPRRRDVLVARFTLLALRADSGDALVTGQTMPVSTDHVALLARPAVPPRVIRRVEHRRFWTGAAIGAALGLIAGILID